MPDIGMPDYFAASELSAPAAHAHTRTVPIVMAFGAGAVKVGIA